MPFTIVLRTIDDIKRFRTKITGLKIQLFTFQATTLRKFAEIIILDKIHENMRSAGFSEKIIEGTILDNIELIGRTKARDFCSKPLDVINGSQYYGKWHKSTRFS